MASFSAELQVAGQRYPVRHCSYEFTQATGERGRVSAKVRHGLVRLTLDVPHDDVLLGWAAAPHKPLGGQVVFFDGRGGPVLETLAWEAGECVGYREDFASGEADAGAYVCHLTIAAPQLSMRPGGPAAYVSPAPGEHGGPQQGLVDPFVVPLLNATPAAEAVAEAVAETVAASLLVPIALILALILGSTTPAQAPGIPQPHFPPINPDELRLRELVAKHAAGTLAPDEEAELIALLGKVKGIHIQRLENLNASGPLRGNEQPLPGFYLTDLAYTKRPQADVTKLRSQFASVRKQFVKDLVADPAKIAHLKKVGMNDADLELMAKGGVPKSYRVHHKLPLDDGGDNSVTNLMLIEDDPWHLAITNLQNVNTVGLQPGQTINLKWPMYNGDIYP
ncbi:MAG TPA: type VI secretion system tube protein TssD [Hymenobacter sp.]|jgi:hypothetical protein|uniref:type VI secretion system tube protein TssD n=1 Tax=Hymenobacter sp. TaxID=1898978 RepID=UPI002ED81330